MKRSIVLLICVTICACVSSGDVISYLRFEENGGALASDQTGLLDGELTAFDNTSPGGGDTGDEGWSTTVPSPLVPLTGQANTSSIRFSGGSEFVDLSNGSDLFLGTSFTIEFFMKPDQPVVASPMFGFEPVSDLHFLLGVSSDELVLRGQFQEQIDGLIPATLVAIGEWQHFALVVESAEYSVYIDGQQQYNGPLPSGGGGPYFFPGTDHTGDRTIGGDSGTWRGYLDEFRISDEALTPDQFLNHVIPEPSTAFLFALAGLALGLRRRNKRFRRPVHQSPERAARAL